MFLLKFLIEVYSLAVLFYALLSWFPQLHYNPLYRALETLVEPLLEPIRKVVPPIGGIDLSPAILLFILYFLERLL